jgi:hypothetical protein
VLDILSAYGRIDFFWAWLMARSWRDYFVVQIEVITTVELAENKKIARYQQVG